MTLNSKITYKPATHYTAKNGVLKRYPKERSQKSKNAWHHNGLIGGISMSKSTMQRIIDSHTCDVDQKQFAREILSQLTELEKSLKIKRID